MAVELTSSAAIIHCYAGLFLRRLAFLFPAPACYGDRDASEKRTDDNGEHNPDHHLRHKADLHILRPKSHAFGKTRRDDIVVGMPIAANREVHQYRNWNPRRVAVRYQHLPKSRPREERNYTANHHQQQPDRDLAGELKVWSETQIAARKTYSQAQNREPMALPALAGG